MPKRPQVYGTSGPDELFGTGVGEDIYGGGGNDVLHGGGGDDQLSGNEGDDILYGDAGNDRLFGQEGNDTLFGGAGNDTLGFGGYGYDELSGGDGSDIFFSGAWSWTDQQVGAVLITDFQSGSDILDLTRFDANESTAPGVIKGNRTPGNEAFTIVASTDGITPGHLVITTGVDGAGNPITIILAYTNTTPGADIEIHLSGTTTEGEPIIGPQDIWL